MSTKFEYESDSKMLDVDMRAPNETQLFISFKNVTKVLSIRQPKSEGTKSKNNLWGK